ncbi:hypothetical protein ACLKA7_000038 [Drosophila subpalustris]
MGRCGIRRSYRISFLPAGSYLQIDFLDYEMVAILDTDKTGQQRTAINKTNNKRIPVPDPSVPALPETDTLTPSPSRTPEQMTDEIQKINKLMLPDYPSIEGLIHPWKCRELAGNRYSEAINCRQVTLYLFQKLDLN